MGARAAGVRVHVRVGFDGSNRLRCSLKRVCSNCASNWLRLNVCICFLVEACNVSRFDGQDVKDSTRLLVTKDVCSQAAVCVCVCVCVLRYRRSCVNGSVRIVSCHGKLHGNNRERCEL